MSSTLVFRAPVTVRCDCGDTFTLASRSYSRHLAQGTTWRCSICRRKTPQISPSRYTNYWLDRYPIEWIKETAGMIWDDV